jgi:hypothetical protein
MDVARCSSHTREAVNRCHTVSFFGNGHEYSVTVIGIY